jgi:hypothetical protein
LCGSEHKSGECLVQRTVIDADTTALVDNDRVYIAYIESFSVSQVRYSIGLTGDNVTFQMLAACNALNIIDVDNKGYLPSGQAVCEAGALLFGLEKLSP